MDLLDTIHSRRAVRSFTGASLDEATITALIEAAIQAPSAMNQQLWSFVVVVDRKMLERISRAAKQHMLRTSPAGLAPHHLHTALEDPSFDIFYKAPALIVIVGPADNAWTTIDCSLAAENLMLAARAAGLGTCWIGLAQGWLGTPEGKAALGLEAGQTAVAPIIVGHPGAEPPAVPRRAPQIRWIKA